MLTLLKLQYIQGQEAYSCDLTHIFHVGQKVRVFVADDIWQKWHKGTVKETHEDYILVDVPDICDHMQYENDYIGDVRPEYNFHLDELEG